jgi:chemotaxis protein MotB
MKIYSLLIGSLLGLLLISCVSNKKFKTMQQTDQSRFDSLHAAYMNQQNALQSCTDSAASANRQKAALENQINDLNKQMAMLKENNTQALRQLQDLAVISS